MTKPKAKATRSAKGAGADSRSARGGGGPILTGEEAHVTWGRRNYLLLGLGALTIMIGFLFLAFGDTTIAPILLVGGYLVLIPWGIVAARRNEGAGGVERSP